MNKLIPINEKNGQQVVSARELYNFLEIKTTFTDWCKRMFEYGFEENKDYSLLKIGERSAHNKIDYALTIDAAKEISMLQRSEKGKQTRQYFIECEKKLRQVFTLPQTFSEALKLAASQAEQIEQQNTQLKLQQPRVIFADAVSASKTSILVGDLAKILKQNGVNTGAQRFFDWLRENNYLIKRKGTDFNMPTQKSMELGLFEIKETAITHSDGHVTVSKTPKVTGKGQEYFVNKFLNQNAA